MMQTQENIFEADVDRDKLIKELEAQLDHSKELRLQLKELGECNAKLKIENRDMAEIVQKQE